MAEFRHAIRTYFFLQVSPTFLNLPGPSNQLMNPGIYGQQFAYHKSDKFTEHFWRLLRAARGQYCVIPAPQPQFRYRTAVGLDLENLIDVKGKPADAHALQNASFLMEKL